MPASPDRIHPETRRAAHEMGVDLGELQQFLNAADLTPPTPGQTDDLPRLRTRIAELTPAAEED